MRLLLACLATLPLLGKPARADPVTVRAEAQTLSVDCAGQDAEIGGNRNTVTFTGACRSLTLRGDANRVAIALASGARLDVEGNGNTIRYSVAGGGQEPAVRVSGSNTDLAATGPTAPQPPSSDPVRLTGDNQRLAVDCSGRDVDIQGNRARYVLRGGCKSLSVHGEGNTVQAELQPLAKVVIEGNATVLTYSVTGGGGDADITVRGTDSRAVRAASLGAAPVAATPAAPPAPAPPPPPSPSPSQQAVAPAPAPAPTPAPGIAPGPAVPSASVPQLMHDLQGKVVAAGTLVSFSQDMLFDGTGALHDDAAKRLGMLAALIGQIHPSGLRVTATDPANAEAAKSRARAVAAWLAERGQIRLKTQSDGARGTPPRIDVLILR